MPDLLVIAVGFVVGALLVVAVNGTRRGRPLPAAANGRRGRTDESPHHYPPARPPAGPDASSAPADPGIRVNLPGAAAPVPAPSAPSPAAGPPVLAKSAAAKLVIDGKAEVDLGDEPVTLGRGNDRTMRVVDSRASRNHALVRRRSKGRDGWEVKDDGSANGTYLNGHRIPDGRVAPLRHGDRIGIGDTDVTYIEGGAPPPAGPVDLDDDRTQVQPR